MALKIPKSPKEPNIPHEPNGGQLKNARKSLGFSDFDKIKNISDRIKIPLDPNSIKRIEKGEKPHPPTKDTSPNYPLLGSKTGYLEGTNYKDDAFGGALNCYERRFHLFLSLYGSSFFSDGSTDTNRNSYFIFQQILDALDIIEDRDVKARGLLTLIEKFCEERHPPEFKHVNNDSFDRVGCWRNQNLENKK